MGTDRKGVRRTERNVNPQVTGTYHQHTAVEQRDDPHYRDGVSKDLVGRKVVEFVDDDTGFLKLRRALDCADLHLTWTWSIGPLAGRYVYARVFAWQVAYGLELLWDKKIECEEGTRKATIDKLGHR